MDDYTNLAAENDFPPELRYYVCIHALFNADRNICKYWKNHKAIFDDFLEEDGDLGKKHLL